MRWIQRLLLLRLLISFRIIIVSLKLFNYYEIKDKVWITSELLFEFCKDKYATCLLLLVQQSLQKFLWNWFLFLKSDKILSYCFTILMFYCSTISDTLWIIGIQSALKITLILHRISMLFLLTVIDSYSFVFEETISCFFTVHGNIFKKVSCSILRVYLCYRFY